jgi:hypothetical protein
VGSFGLQYGGKRVGTLMYIVRSVCSFRGAAVVCCSYQHNGCNLHCGVILLTYNFQTTFN